MSEADLKKELSRIKVLRRATISDVHSASTLVSHAGEASCVERKFRRSQADVHVAWPSLGEVHTGLTPEVPQILTFG